MALRAVLDTDILVAALRSGLGASRQILLSALDKKFEMLISVPLLLEYEAVLTRTEHLAASGLRAEEAAIVLDDVAATARPVRLSFHWRARLPDADDDMVLETAVNGGASTIVTFNRRHFVAEAAAFGLEISLPGEFLLRLKEKSDAEE